jgi:hypothetical protein
MNIQAEYKEVQTPAGTNFEQAFALAQAALADLPAGMEGVIFRQGKVLVRVTSESIFWDLLPQYHKVAADSRGDDVLIGPKLTSGIHWQ